MASAGDLPERVASLEAHMDHLATKEDLKLILVELQSKMIWMIVMFLLSLVGAIASAIVGWLT